MMKYFAALVLGAMMMTACSEDYLETSPTNSLDAGQLKESVENFESYINGINLLMVYQQGAYGQGYCGMMNLLSKSEVFAENKLFATLDTTVRKVTIENLPFLLSDTVGFIRKLPHHLVESFKSTLDEVREADLLIHVVDISHPNFEEQYEVVEQTINELLTKETEIKESDPWSKKQQTARKSEKTVAQIPRIVVFNKVDAFTYTPKEEDDLTPMKRENISLEELKKTWMAKLHDDCIFISAKEKTNIDELKSLFYDRIKAIHIQRYPYNDFLFQQYE